MIGLDQIAGVIVAVVGFVIIAAFVGFAVTVVLAALGSSR